MSPLEHLFSESHLRAIAAMLFHSVWQGTLLAVVAALFLMFTKRSSPAIRYNVLVSLLFVFTAGAVYTYIIHLDQALLSANPVSASGSLPNDERAAELSRGNAYSSLTRFLNDNESLIVLCWLVLLITRLCYISTGYYSAQKLAKTNLISPPEEWKQRWTVLLQQMQISQTVLLMESALAKVPMVIGHFKPVVLVPAGMLMSLSPAEAEAILLHELAHVKRRDYLLNLLQQVVQSIFFFHPAVSWVCSVINSEREHCCDDIAASYNGDKRVYISALVSFYEKALAGPGVLGFSGTRNQSVLERIKRMINHRNKTINNMEKILLTAALVLTGLFVYAFYQTENGKNTNVFQIAATDSIPKEKKEMTWTKDGKKVVVVFQNGEISELTVDGKKIPPNKYGEYKDLINDIENDQREAVREAERAKEEAEEAIVEEQEAHEEAIEKSERAKRDHEDNRGRGRRNNDEIHERDIDNEEINEIIADAMNEVNKVLDELRVELKDGKLRDEVRDALQDAKEGLEEARRELREKQYRHERERKRDFADELGQVTEEAIHLALDAAHLGLREANVELENELNRDDHDGSEKIDRKEYRERKRQLREQYRNSQRNRE